MLRALTFSFLLLSQFSSAQKFFREMGLGVMGEINYLRLTNDGGKGGFGHGAGFFIFFPIGNHLELKGDLYFEASRINYQFNYIHQTQSTIKYISEEGKEKIDITPFVLQLNYFPGNQKNFFAGAGYSPRQVLLLEVDGKATYSGTNLTTNQPISGETFAAGSQTQYPLFGNNIFGSAYRWIHCGVLNAGYKYKFGRATFRLQYSFSNVIVDDLHIEPGSEYLDYPVQHMIVVSVTADIDLIMLIRMLTEKKSH